MPAGSDGRVLIVAQAHQGHRLMYVRLLAEAVLARNGTAIIALTDAGTRSREYEIHLGVVATRCAVAILDSGPLSASRLCELAARHGCARILVPDGDRFAIRLGLMGWRSQATMVVLVNQDPRWNTSRRLAVRTRLAFKGLILRRTQRMPGVRLLYLTDHCRPAGRTRPLTAPDPVLFDAAHRDQVELRKRLGLAEEKFWFLVAGNISARKNLPMVIEALLALQNRRAALFVRGEIQPSVRDRIAPLLVLAKTAGVSIVVHDRVHTDSELNEAVQAVDCVVVAYSSDQPNSMMAKGARAGRQVVVAGSSSLRGWAQNLGVALRGPLDHSSLRELMRQAMRVPAPAPRRDLDHRAFVGAFF